MLKIIGLSLRRNVISKDGVVASFKNYDMGLQVSVGHTARMTSFLVLAIIMDIEDQGRARSVGDIERVNIDILGLFYL